MVILDLRISRDLESQKEYAIAASYFVRSHEHFVSQFIVEPYCRNSGFEVVEREGAAARVSLFTFRVTASRIGLGPKT